MNPLHQIKTKLHQQQQFRRGGKSAHRALPEYREKIYELNEMPVKTFKELFNDYDHILSDQLIQQGIIIKSESGSYYFDLDKLK